MRHADSSLSIHIAKQVIQSAIILLLAALLFCSCCKTKDANCTDPILQPVFVGYSVTDIDTFIVRMYKANDGFKTLLDTFKISKCSGSDSNVCYSLYPLLSDTISVFIAAGYVPASNNPNLYCEIRKGYDWSIYIPSVDHSDSISDITTVQTTTSYEDCFCGCKAPPPCSNKISFKQNEEVIDPAGFSSDIAGFRDVVFIHK